MNDVYNMYIYIGSLDCENMELWLNVALNKKWLLKGELYTCMWLEWKMWENACLLKCDLIGNGEKWSMNIEIWICKCYVTIGWY